ncbi:Oidioi.mRNA.OKI2018_I69.chr2.g6383.t1.cds [Oikopleura dioica]|uniref:Oidioi.mRNA.OKI2018_I69.chr2.g6383.t1.cds n=1 Tax=Oikopleura dioica TaxID=34765 RepID=A0ABN7T7L4_OIKDI|nr:Oidioi.mRNA.OKI2018_I69.chr2.g6383.t1.cds [Oikopleura dioica]
MESPASADEERISLKSLQKRKIIVTPSELKEPRIIVPEAEQWLHAFSDMTQKVALLTLETETLAEELGKLEKLKMDRQQEIARTQKAELLDDKRKEVALRKYRKVMRRLPLIAAFIFPFVFSSDYAEVLCALGKEFEFCENEMEKWKSSENRREYCEPFFASSRHLCLPMTLKGTVAAIECPDYLMVSKLTNQTFSNVHYIQIECGTDLLWRIEGKRILQKIGNEWDLNAIGDDRLKKEMNKCTNEAPVDRYRRNTQFSNETEFTTEPPLPQAECLDKEMFHHQPCRKDAYGKITCDCRNFNFCAEDYIILVGNSISMVPLFLSIVILFSFPRLRNTRNLIHANLMTSLFLRSALQWLNYHAVIFGAYPDAECMLSVQHLSKEEYMRMTLKMCPGSQFIAFCRASIVFLQWAKTASHFWVLIEGVQLYALAVVTVLSTAKYFYAYLAFGWGFSWISVVFWVVLKYKYENRGCWDITYRDLLEKVIEVPISAAITLNGIIFIILIWVIVLKLRDDSRLTRERNNAQRLTRATLTLIPLMGTQYLLFRYTPSEKLFNIRYKYDLFFEGLQGLFVSILFCFMNQEVQRELKKWYSRRMQPRGDRRQSVWDERETITTQVRRESSSANIVASKNPLLPIPVAGSTPPTTL